MEELVIYGLIFFIFGTVFGSFFNVVGYRLPKNMSLLYPESHCPNCQHKLSPLELIPVVSYIAQGGKCKNCKEKIAIFYPIFEALTGLLFTLSYLIFGFTPMLYLALVFVSTLLIVILSDIKYMIIPDELIIFSGIVLVILRLIFYKFDSIVPIMVDMLVPFLVLILVKMIGDFLFKKESLGGGDIKLMIIFGLVIGWEMSILSVFLAAFIAFPISLFFLIEKKEHVLPFGPYLSAAALIIMFFKINLEYIVSLLI